MALNSTLKRILTVEAWLVILVIHAEAAAQALGAVSKTGRYSKPSCRMARKSDSCLSRL
jgi:hypothetical protein